MFKREGEKGTGPFVCAFCGQPVEKAEPHDPCAIRLMTTWDTSGGLQVTQACHYECAKLAIPGV